MQMFAAVVGQVANSFTSSFGTPASASLPTASLPTSAMQPASAVSAQPLPMLRKNKKK